MKRPGTLVYVICLALVVFSAGMNGDAGAGTEGLEQADVLRFPHSVFMPLSMWLRRKRDFPGGASFFSMADANPDFYRSCG